ncbi:hypothetical protein CLV37_12911 [Kineococcus rhizosphaerae]|uniref:Uncharacterized protein n=1 Tax=Kineococcus rhizosphaerae TaxID=559628 RepID=A0A2T0QR75_9ACTN|nr:hypothetical protein CLV37_12911 [Kineococcus rhizosphaerae]
MVSTPTRVLIAVNGRSIVGVGRNHPTHTQRCGVPLIRRPGLQQQVYDRVLDAGIRKGQPAPFPGQIIDFRGRVPRQSPETVQVRLSQIVPCPVEVITNVGHPADAQEATNEGVLRPTPLGGRKLKQLTPLRRKVAQVDLMAGVLLRDLNFNDNIGAWHGQKQGRNRLTHLKIHGSALDLEDDIVVELPVQPLELIVCGPGTVSTAVTPVLAVVVHKAPPVDASPMLSQRARQQIRTLSVVASVVVRTGLTLRTRLDQKATEVRNPGVDALRSRGPPRRNRRISRISGVEVSGQDGGGKVYAQVGRDRETTQNVGDAGNARQEFIEQRDGVGVHVHIVQGQGVHSGGGQQAGVVGDPA